MMILLSGHSFFSLIGKLYKGRTYMKGGHLSVRDCSTAGRFYNKMEDVTDLRNTKKNALLYFHSE